MNPKASTTIGGADNEPDQRKNAFKGRMTTGSFSQKKSSTLTKKSGIANTAQQPSSLVNNIRASVAALESKIEDKTQVKQENNESQNETDKSSLPKEESTIKEPIIEIPVMKKISSSPEHASPKLTKRSPRITGLNLSKHALSAGLDPSNKSQTSNESESGKNGEESGGLVGVNFKDLMLSKKRIQLKSPNKVEPKSESKDKKAEREQKSKNSAPVLPKIKELSVRKSFFAKALEESQTSFRVRSLDSKALPSSSEAKEVTDTIESSQNILDYSKKIDMIISSTPKLAQMFGRSDKSLKRSESLKLGGIVMKAIPRSEPQSVANPKDSKTAKNSQVLKKMVRGQLDNKRLAFLQHNQHNFKTIDNGTNTPKRSPKGLKEFLNQKINESEKLKDQISHSEAAINPANLRARLLFKMNDPHSKFNADRLFGDESLKNFPQHNQSSNNSLSPGKSAAKERHVTPEKSLNASMNMEEESKQEKNTDSKKPSEEIATKPREQELKNDEKCVRNDSNELNTSNKKSTKNHIEPKRSLNSIKNGLKNIETPSSKNINTEVNTEKVLEEKQESVQRNNSPEKATEPKVAGSNTKDLRKLTFAVPKTNKDSTTEEETKVPARKSGRSATTILSLKNLAKLDDVTKNTDPTPDFSSNKIKYPLENAVPIEEIYKGIRATRASPILSQNNFNDQALPSPSEESKPETLGMVSRTSINEKEPSDTSGITVDVPSKQETSSTKGNLKIFSTKLMRKY